MSTVGEAYKANVLTNDALNEAVSGYLADPSQPYMLEVGAHLLDVAAAVLAQPYAVDVLAREDATPVQRRTAVRTAILLARVG